MNRPISRALINLEPLPRRWRWPVQVLFGLAALALLWQFVTYGQYAAALFQFPFDYDQGEGFELYDTVLHAQGQWPYQDSQVFPFYTSIYPPLFHALTVPLVWVFGPHLWTGRVVGFTASLITALAIGWGVHRATRHPLIAGFSGLTYLASNYTFHVGPLFRQHITMVMFETLAIVALAQVAEAGRGWTRQRAFWVGCGCLLAAGYTKQLALATVIAGLGFLFLRGPRRAFLTGLGLAAVAGGLFVWIDWSTQGWWYISIIRANINAFDWAQAISFYKQWLSLHSVIALCAAVTFIYELYFGRLSAYALWFACAFANGALSGKFGAGESYFVTTTAAACLVSGLTLARLWHASSQWRLHWAIPTALLIPVLYLVQTVLTWHMYTDNALGGTVARWLGLSAPADYYDSQGYTQLGPRPTLADIAAGYRIVEHVINAPCPHYPVADRAACPVLSEEAAFLFVANKMDRAVSNPFPQLVMYQAGLFDPQTEMAMIQAQAFGLIILRGPPHPTEVLVGFYPPPVLSMIQTHYQVSAEIPMNGFWYRLLEPRP